MDASEDDLDIKLQKVSSELISTFDQRLGTFLRKPDGVGQSRVRSCVRTREAVYLMSSVSEDQATKSQTLTQLICKHG